MKKKCVIHYFCAVKSSGNQSDLCWSSVVSKQQKFCNKHLKTVSQQACGQKDYVYLTGWPLVCTGGLCCSWAALMSIPAWNKAEDRNPSLRHIYPTEEEIQAVPVERSCLTLNQPGICPQIRDFMYFNELVIIKHTFSHIIENLDQWKTIFSRTWRSIIFNNSSFLIDLFIVSLSLFLLNIL